METEDMLNHKVCHKFYITEGASPARTSIDSKLLQKQIADSSLYKIFPSFFGECYPFPYKILYSMNSELTRTKLVLLSCGNTFLNFV